RLATQGQTALLQSVLVTQGSQQLLEAIKAMERNARQYQVLGDKVLFDVYAENHDRFIDTARTLEALEIARVQRELLQELRVTENEAYTVLSTYPHDAGEVEDILPAFIDLGLMGQRILIDSQQLITTGVEEMQDESETVKRTLFLQAVALVPAVLLLMIIVVFLISRPIRQIDRAIRRLGDGDFSESANISGPRDLEQLGERLDWLRDRLLELEQGKTRYLQHKSHELKTPLTAIREGADLLREKIVGELNSQQEEIAGILHENSLQLQKLIEDLLNFSILQSRTAALVSTRIELQPLIEEVLDTHKLAMLARHVRLETSMQPVSFTGDHDKIRTLVDNLVSNAIKYSPENGRLRVGLSSDRAYAYIEVTDSGPGIPEAEHEQVFEAFYQGKPASQGPVRGTGLGLSIAREYARAHGGDVSVVKSNRGGASLRVVLPTETD
ncbi:MAG: HAMP domain-containing protein, partial [Gammaproteobacteria bacterium]|nr:HAMP domain-containing protein [Gammaproteobacteria bacterium]